MNAKNWYKDANEFIKSIFKEDADLFCALLAATSPQQSVKSNWTIAMAVYKDYKSTGSTWFNYLMKSHKKNVHRALTGQELSGPKVRAFYRNLIGDYNAVTIDTWMLRIFKVEKRQLTLNQHKRLERVFQRFARSKGFLPAELQAILWMEHRAKQGFKPVSYIEAGQDSLQMEFNFETIPF